jgi:hypothetical protein
MAMRRKCLLTTQSGPLRPAPEKFWKEIGQNWSFVTIITSRSRNRA